MGGCRWTSIWRLATLSRLVFGRRFAGEDGVRHRPPQRQAAGCGCRQPQARICDRGRFFSCDGRVWVLGSSQYLLPLSSSVFLGPGLEKCPLPILMCSQTVRSVAALVYGVSGRQQSQKATATHGNTIWFHVFTMDPRCAIGVAGHRGHPAPPPVTDERSAVQEPNLGPRHSELFPFCVG